jgi:hypothetical protein
MEGCVSDQMRLVTCWPIHIGTTYRPEVSAAEESTAVGQRSNSQRPEGGATARTLRLTNVTRAHPSRSSDADALTSLADATHPICL